jgi:hypothetical protein
MGRLTMKKALITGVTGQDGSCLPEFLLATRTSFEALVREMVAHDVDCAPRQAAQVAWLRYRLDAGVIP